MKALAMAQASERFLGRLAIIGHLIAAYAAVPAIVILVGLDVVLRYFFAAPLSWVQEACSLLLFLALVLALSSSWLKGLHVRMEMVHDLLPWRLGRAADLLSAVCGAILFGMVGWQAARDIPYMRMMSESSEELGILLWPFRLLLVVVSILLLLQFLFYFGWAMIDVVKGRRSDGGS